MKSMDDSLELMSSPASRSGQSDHWFDLNHFPHDDVSALTLSRQNHSNSCASPAMKVSSSCAVVLLNRDHPASRPVDHHTSTSSSPNSSPVNGLLSSMEGKTWSQFIAQDKSPDQIRVTSKSNDCENMRLKKEDIPIFGLFPARDHFYFTKCDDCGQVVKYQALAHHMESRHSQPVVGIETPPSSTRSESSGSTSSLSNNLTSCDQPSSGLDATEYNSVTISRLTPSPGTDSPGAEAPTVARLSHQQNGSASTGLCINISSMSITSSSSSSSAHPVRNNNNNNNNHTSCETAAAPDVTISSQTETSSASSDASPAGVSLLKSTVTSVKTMVSGIISSNHSNTLTGESPADILTPASSGSKSKKSASSCLSSILLKEKLLPCKDRQYDPDKHCGALTEHMDKACTRSLTCKTHSLTLRRQVAGRSKPFDDLLEEHRVAKEEAMRLAGKEVKLTKKQIKQREAEAKKAQAAQQKADKTDSKSVTMSPTSSSQPSPASSPCLTTGSRTPLSSSTLPFLSTALSSPAPVQSGSQNITSPSPITTKQSLQNNLTAKIKRKEDLEQQQQLLQQLAASELKQKSDNNNRVTDLPLPPPLIPIRDNIGQSLLIHRPVDKRMRYEGPDGIDYMKYPPRPLAVNTYNTRVRNLNNSRTFDASSISSRMFSRATDRTYTVIRKAIQLQENTSAPAPVPQSASKSKKKKTTGSKSATVTDACGSRVQSPGLASEFDPIVNMAPPVTTCLPNHSKNSISATISKNHEQQDSPGRKRPAPASSISSVTPSLASLLESGTCSNPSPSVPVATVTANCSNYSPALQISTGTTVLNQPPTDATGISPVCKRLRPSDEEGGIGNDNSTTTGSYALSSPSLESLLDAGIGSRTQNRSLLNESSSHSILSATLESGYNPNLINRTPDITGTGLPAKPPVKSSNVQNSPHLISLLDSRTDVTSGGVAVASGLRSHAAVAFNKKGKADPKLNNNLMAGYSVRQKVAASPNSS